MRCDRGTFATERGQLIEPLQLSFTEIIWTTIADHGAASSVGWSRARNRPIAELSP